MPFQPTRRDINRALALLAGTATAAGAARAAAAGRDDGPAIRIDARPEPVRFDPTRTAMLVIDMQNDFGADGGMFARAGIDIRGIKAVVPAVARALASARAAAIPVIYLKMAFRPDLSDAGPRDGPNLVKHAPLKVGEPVIAPDGSRSRILVRDTWNSDILPALAPVEGDLVLYKTRFSGFSRTGLGDRLRSLGVETLLVTGCTTSVCVESTVRDAMFEDFTCIVLEDCTAEPIGADAARSNHDASLLVMETLFGWISDSGRLAAALAGQRARASAD